MHRRWSHLWLIGVLGIVVASAIIWVKTRPPEFGPVPEFQAVSGEPSAADIAAYLRQVQAGTDAYRARREAEAVQAFEAATVLQPSEPIPYRYLAELHWRAGRSEQAMQAVRALASAMPEAYFLDQVGRGYEEAGLRGLAMQVYGEAIRLDGQFPGARYNLGRMYLEAGHLEEGIAEMQAVIHLHPDFPQAHQALGMAYTERGRWDDAIAHLQRTLALAPDLTVVRNHLGRIYMAQGRLQEAIQTFRALVERAPEVAEARHNLAVAYARQGLQEPAVEQFGEALRLRPDLHAARLDLASLLIEQGRTPEAISTLEAAFAGTAPQFGAGAPPELVEVRYRLGVAYAVAGRRQEAVQELEGVLQAQPTHAAAHASLGRLYYQLRQFTPAWRHARRAESLGLPVADLLAALRKVAVEPQ
jgi:tetratricopeptide (TPR) repeat protein